MSNNPHCCSCCCATEDFSADTVKDFGIKHLAAGDNFTPCTVNINIDTNTKQRTTEL